MARTSPAPTRGAANSGGRHAPPRGDHVGFERAIARSLAALDAQGRTPTPVQQAMFEALRAPGPLVVTAPTGSGKTAAVMLPLLADLDERLALEPEAAPGVRVLYLAPVRALADGHCVRLRELVDALGAKLKVDVRTGDSTSAHRAKLRRAPPEVLVTTPESLAVMLGTEARDGLALTECVVLDELHLLAAGKRGALLSATLETLAALTRARGRPSPRRVAMSATARPIDALAAWVSPDARVVAVAGGALAPTLDLADPRMDDAYPSAGWTWRAALPTVARAIATNEGATLVFVGARGRAEQWTLALRDVLPARVAVACFHGSLSAEERGAVAVGMRDATLRAVVATSGLETGVDLPAVSRVMVLASPPSVTRLVQAAGRAEHRPGASPRATLVATSAPDLVRCAAALTAARAGELEAVELRAYDLDVAAQAVLGRVALAPCTRDEIAETLRASWTFRDLDDDDLDEVIDYLATGGDGFAAYPELARIVTDGERWAIASKRSLRRYLQAIGTIVGDAVVPVRNGEATVGQVEGRFAAMLDVGDRFVLGARVWRVASVGAEVQVRPDRGQQSTVPSWAGARPAQSEVLSAACERVWAALEDALALPDDGARLAAISAALSTGADNARFVLRLLRAQRAVSTLPTPARFVLELVHDKRRTHLVAFTMAGATANEVIARAVATRARRVSGGGAEVAATDECAVITFATLAETPTLETLRAWLSPDGLFDDLLGALDGGALAGAYFREVARVAQLWMPENTRSSVTPGLLYDVLRKHDPDHVLLRALRFTLWTALDGPRAERCLAERARRPWSLATLDTPSALAVPAFAWAERDAVRPDDPEAALAAAAHALFQRTAALAERER